MSALIDLDFADPQLAVHLADAGPEDLDGLRYGVIGIDADGIVVRYNAWESQAAGLAPARVIGQPLFTRVAPCMNTPLVAGAFAEAASRREPLDRTVPYLLTLRMRPTRVQLRLLEADKSPARGATVLMAPEHPETAWDAGTMQATPDPAGRLNLLLAPGSWTVFVRSANSMACQRLVVEHGIEATLALSLMPAMRGRVVGKDGKPIAGATLDLVSMSRMGLDGLRPPEEQVAEHLNWKWLDDVRSDADGNFLAPFVPVSGASYEAVFHHGPRQSARFQVQVGADPVTITID